MSGTKKPPLAALGVWGVAAPAPTDGPQRDIENRMRRVFGNELNRRSRFVIVKISDTDAVATMAATLCAMLGTQEPIQTLPPEDLDSGASPTRPRLVALLRGMMTHEIANVVLVGEPEVIAPLFPTKIHKIIRGPHWSVDLSRSTD